MARAKMNYKPGDIFAVPLKGGGFARGLVVISNEDARIFGYFWGPRIGRIEDCKFNSSLDIRDSIYVKIFSGLGLLKGVWRVAGKLPNFDPSQWPLPDFVHEGSGKYWIRSYDGESLREVRNLMVDPRVVDIKSLPTDGVAGYGFIENRLSERLPLIHSNPD